MRSELEGAEGISSLLLTGDGVHVVVDDAAHSQFLSLRPGSDAPEFRSMRFIRLRHPSKILFVDAVGAECCPMPEIANSVVVESLVKRFGDFVAVDRINLEVRKGEVFGFLGPNGAGKSTTIRMLCGLLKPTSGPRAGRGFDVSRKPEAVRQNIGYMSQKFSLYNDLTVIENIRLFAGLYSVPSKELQGRIEWALTMANLKGQENLITGTLPGGWKQRLALGCAVLAQAAHHLSR